MSGIYIHYPFCRQKCHYCNFFSLASSKSREVFTEVLLEEIRLQHDYLGGAEIGTVYLGGGTPSLLSSREIDMIFNQLHRYFSLSPDAEITLEANPDDLSAGWLKELNTTPVNRLSIGVQSFRDEDLVYLRRVHDGKQAERAVVLARNHSFENLSLDLIYGIPTLDRAGWQSNLEKAVSLAVPHISAYCLTVEPHTALDRLISKGKLPGIQEEAAADQFRQLMSFLKSRNYLHYEISNFCLEGKHARHNTAYWQGIPYLGLGPSAHSFNGMSRQWNVSLLDRYLEEVCKDNVHREVEMLSDEQKYNEYVMTSLRTMWGCDTGHVAETFGESFADHLLRNAGPHIVSGLIIRNGRLLVLGTEGKLFADRIASDLFMA